MVVAPVRYPRTSNNVYDRIVEIVHTSTDKALHEMDLELVQLQLAPSPDVFIAIRTSKNESVDVNGFD
jgi:hypothetical protein